MDSSQIVKTAFKNRFVIPAFNIPYLPMMEPVVAAVAEEDSFAFIEVARLEWEKFEAVSPEAVMGEYRRFGGRGHTRLHLDHVPVIDEDGQAVNYTEILERAVKAGYDSVMVDGSRLSLEDNIKSTIEAVWIAHGAGIPCEAELGAVLGHESGPAPPYDELFRSGKGFTDVSEAAEFVSKSGCDWLSVAIGNIHGAISQAARGNKKIEARLNIGRLAALRDATGIPLVLHGGSGILKPYISDAILTGIAKINVGTEIRQVYERALAETGDVGGAQNAVYETTRKLLREFFEVSGSAGYFVDEQDI